MDLIMSANYINKVVILLILLLTITGNEYDFKVNANPTEKDYAGKNITRILDEFFENDKYDKRVRPNYGALPVEVGVTMHIVGISSVSEVQMDFTSDFYFRQKWKDNRLSFEPHGGITELVVGSEVAKRIWVPDTFFANEKVASFHDATTPNTFLRIDYTGHVYRSIRLE